MVATASSAAADISNLNVESVHPQFSATTEPSHNSVGVSERILGSDGSTGRCVNKKSYRISSCNFLRNYSFLNVEIQSSQYIRPKVTVHKGAELFKGGNYSRAETI
jgi:hypothetical protein